MKGFLVLSITAASWLLVAAGVRADPILWSYQTTISTREWTTPIGGPVVTLAGDSSVGGSLELTSGGSSSDWPPTSLSADVEVQATPEPAGLVLAGVGLCGLGLAAWRVRGQSRTNPSSQEGEGT